MRNLVGQQLGNYQLVRLLGKGGFAEVYLGEHCHLKTQAAIKVLHTSLEGEDVEKFRQEAQTVAHLKHPHIVRVFDFDVEEHIPFLVMDFFPRGSLRLHHPKGVSLPLPTIMAYVKQIADALQYAHTQQVIHRDIKPENMLLGQNNEVVLVDFGISLLSQSSRSQSTQEVAGTAAYMAPEQFRGKPRRASDQYALGIVVYEWISGDLPFHGSFTEIASQHLFVAPPPLRGNATTLPLAVERVVLKALAKDPEQRFENVHSFAIALEQASNSLSTQSPHASASPTQFSQPTGVTTLSDRSLPTPELALLPDQLPAQTKNATLSNLPSSSAALVAPSNPSSQLSAAPLSNQSSITPVSTESQQRTISRRTMTAGLIGGLAGVSIVGGSVAWLMAAHSPKTPVHPSPPPTLSLSPTVRPMGTTLYIYHGHSQAQYGVSAATWSPDGKRIASSAGTVQIWDAADGGHVYTHHSFENNYVNSQGIAWSPDGTRIASIENIPVEVWRATDGVHVATHQSYLGWMRALAWAPDSKRIVSGSDEQPGSVEVWDAASGRTVLTYRGHVSPVQAAAWSPNGKWIVSSSMGKLVHVWDATNGAPIYIYNGHPVNQVDSVAWSPDSTRIASAGDDGTVHIWDASNGSHTYIYRGHFQASDQYHTVTTVAWSPNGKRIASGDWNHTVQIWDAVSGGHVYTYQGHSDYITSVAWSPDGTRIVSASRDRTVQVWQAS